MTDFKKYRSLKLTAGFLLRSINRDSEYDNVHRVDQTRSSDFHPILFATPEIQSYIDQYLVTATKTVMRSDLRSSRIPHDACCGPEETLEPIPLEPQPELKINQFYNPYTWSDFGFGHFLVDEETFQFISGMQTDRLMTLFVSKLVYLDDDGRTRQLRAHEFMSMVGFAAIGTEVGKRVYVVTMVDWRFYGRQVIGDHYLSLATLSSQPTWDRLFDACYEEMDDSPWCYQYFSYRRRVHPTDRSNLKTSLLAAVWGQPDSRYFRQGANVATAWDNMFFSNTLGYSGQSFSSDVSGQSLMELLQGDLTDSGPPVPKDLDPNTGQKSRITFSIWFRRRKKTKVQCGDFLYRLGIGDTHFFSSMYAVYDPQNDIANQSALDSYYDHLSAQWAERLPISSHSLIVPWPFSSGSIIDFGNTVPGALYHNRGMMLAPVHQHLYAVDEQHDSCNEQCMIDIDDYSDIIYLDRSSFHRATVIGSKWEPIVERWHYTLEVEGRCYFAWEDYQENKFTVPDVRSNSCGRIPVGTTGLFRIDECCGTSFDPDCEKCVVSVYVPGQGTLLTQAPKGTFRGVALEDIPKGDTGLIQIQGCRSDMSFNVNAKNWSECDAETDDKLVVTVDECCQVFFNLCKCCDNSCCENDKVYFCANGEQVVLELNVPKVIMLDECDDNCVQAYWTVTLTEKTISEDCETMDVTIEIVPYCDAERPVETVSATFNCATPSCETGTGTYFPIDFSYGNSKDCTCQPCVACECDYPNLYVCFNGITYDLSDFSQKTWDVPPECCEDCPGGGKLYLRLVDRVVSEDCSTQTWSVTGSYTCYGTGGGGGGTDPGGPMSIILPMPLNHDFEIITACDEETCDVAFSIPFVADCQLALTASNSNACDPCDPCAPDRPDCVDGIKILLPDDKGKWDGGMLPYNWDFVSASYDTSTGNWQLIARVKAGMWGFSSGQLVPYASSNAAITNHSPAASGPYSEGTVLTIEGTSTPPTALNCSGWRILSTVPSQQHIGYDFECRHCNNQAGDSISAAGSVSATMEGAVSVTEAGQSVSTSGTVDTNEVIGDIAVTQAGDTVAAFGTISGIIE